MTTQLPPDAPSPRRNKKKQRVGRAVTDPKEQKFRHALQNGAAATPCAVNGHSSISSCGQLIFARGGYSRLILLKASHAPEHGVLSLHRDREVHAAQLQHHVIPRYGALNATDVRLSSQLECVLPHAPASLPAQRIPNTLHGGLDFAYTRACP